jgi:hypothetical protein
MHANATDPSAWQGQFVGEAIGLLTGVPVACTLGLVPGQSRAVLGVEVLAAGLLAWSVQIGIHLQAVRGRVGSSPAVRIGRIGLAQAAVLSLPVPGVVAAGGRRRLYWLVPGTVLVAPDGVAGDPVADDDRPVGGVALVGAVGGGVGRLQQVGADVLGWEVVDGQVHGLQQQRPGGVDHGDVAQEGPHAARGRRGPDGVVAAGTVTGHGLEVAALQGVGHGRSPGSRAQLLPAVRQREPGLGPERRVVAAPVGEKRPAARLCHGDHRPSRPAAAARPTPPVRSAPAAAPPPDPNRPGRIVTMTHDSGQARHRLRGRAPLTGPW